MAEVLYEIGKNPSSIEFEKAIEAAADASSDVRICFKGEVELQRPILIGPRAHKLTIEGVDGAVISGGSRITGFEPCGDGLFRTKVDSNTRTRHLYIDGMPAPRPHTEILPPTPWTTSTAEGYEFFGDYTEVSVPRQGDYRIYKKIKTSDSEIASWRNVRDVEMVFEVAWTHSICPIDYVDTLDDGSAVIYPVWPCFRALQSTGGVQIGPRPTYFENVFEYIQPGQWYFDRSESMLYVCLEKGDTPEKHEIMLPKLERLFDIKGSEVTFENLRFYNTTYNAPAIDGHCEVQANVTFNLPEYDNHFEQHEGFNAFYPFRKSPSAIVVAGAKYVSFKGCSFRLLGNGAIDFEHGAQECLVERCEFSNIAGSSVQIGDFTLKDAHPDSRSDIVRCIRVCDCTIHDTGFDYKGSVAVFIGYAQDITVEHNDIYNVSYTAVSVGWGWAAADMTYVDRRRYVAPDNFKHWTEPSVCCRNKILYNHISNAMMLLSDGGAVYMLGAMEGSAVIGNLIHGSAGYVGESYEGFSVSGIDVVENEALYPLYQKKGSPGGIYMDEGVTGVEVSENVIYNTILPLHYHNQIIGGYKKVRVLKNYVNKTPDDPDYPTEAANRAGVRK